MVKLLPHAPQVIPQQRQRFQVSRGISALLAGLLVSMLTLFASACSELPSSFFSDNTQPLRLNIDVVQGLGQSGTYRLAGASSFPDGTQLSLTAVRLFNTPSSNNTPRSQPFIPTSLADYVILDRQFVTVQQGTFDGTLMLTTPSTQLGALEVWQLKQPDFLSVLEPNQEVVFTVTLDPSIQTNKVRAWLRQNLSRASSEFEKYTTDGELYIQSWSQSRVPVPVVSADLDLSGAPQSNGESNGRTNSTGEDELTVPDNTAPDNTASDPSDLFAAVRIFDQTAVSRKAISTDEQATSNLNSDNSQSQPSVWNRTNAPLPENAYLQ
ncbi:MAG: hypothetical protein WBA57_07820 [Elainellaceae cyanobacterium]